MFYRPKPAKFDGIKKGIEKPRKILIQLNLKGTTLPHQVIGRYGSAQVLLKPAAEGTGVIAGARFARSGRLPHSHVLTKSSPARRIRTTVIKGTFCGPS